MDQTPPRVGREGALHHITYIQCNIIQVRWTDLCNGLGCVGLGQKIFEKGWDVHGHTVAVQSELHDATLHRRDRPVVMVVTVVADAGGAPVVYRW